MLSPLLFLIVCTLLDILGGHGNKRNNEFSGSCVFMYSIIDTLAFFDAAKVGVVIKRKKKKIKRLQTGIHEKKKKIQ